MSREIKAMLATELTEAFCTTTGHASEILGIRFFEYEDEMAAVAGNLCDSTSRSPYLHMVVYCPRLKRSTKQKMGAALAAAFSRGVKQSDWIPVIHICEHPYDNVVIGGKLLTDTFEDCTHRSFYYDLPKD